MVLCHREMRGSPADSEQKGDPVRIHDDAICLGWVEGFRDGFTVHAPRGSLEKPTAPCTTLRQAEVLERRTSDSATDIRIDDQFKYSNS